MAVCVGGVTIEDGFAAGDGGDDGGVKKERQGQRPQRMGSRFDPRNLEAQTEKEEADVCKRTEMYKLARHRQR